MFPRAYEAALTGLALPPLEVPASQFGGAWASANSMVFIDLMKHSVPFVAGSRYAGSSSDFGWLPTQRISWRPDGYPAGLSPPPGQQWCVNTTIGQGGAYYSAGVYVVLYDGEGTVEVDGDARAPPLASSPGRLEVDVAPSAAGLRVRITSSSPANPVTNIRLVPAAFETNHTAQVFHPEFLRMLQGIPLLRYAAWMRVDDNVDGPRLAPRSWEDRTTPRHSSQVRQSDGVAVEHLVQLANTVNASMWVSLPRPANDSDPYIYGMLSYIAANLAPHLAVTVEYGVNGPGWMSSRLPAATRLLAAAARAAWVAAGRPAEQLRVVASAPFINAVANILGQLPADYRSWLDGVALPASFGGTSYFTWAGRDNPTAWNDPAFFSKPRDPLTLEGMLKALRSSVLAADVSYNKQFQVLRTRGLQVLGFAAGPELLGPTYGARTNHDRVWSSCLPPPATTTWPCAFGPLYPPWAYEGGPTSVKWSNAAARRAILAGALAANASREASLESLLRQARGHASLYDMLLDSLWRWHSQMGGGDVVVDVSRLARPCASAPGMRSGMFGPDECRTPPRAAPVARPDVGSPAYKALRAWLAAEATEGGGGGARGALPRSAAEAPPAVPPAAPCSPPCVYGSCSYEGRCECWAGASGPGCAVLSPASTPAACNPRVGVNLEGISDWSRSWTFLDVFKASRDWIPQTFDGGPWSSGAPIDLIRSASVAGPTAVGYPASLATGQKVSTLVVRDLQGHAPKGIYTVLYDGKGCLDFSMSDVKDVTYVEAGHVLVNFQPSTDFNNGMLVMVERTDPSDPIRNIRVITPGYTRQVAAGRPFHPALLAFLRPFGVLRFMDWMHTNHADLPVSWEDRPGLEDRSYAVHPGGVPLEHMVLLANTLGADPWFNMPHAASDDYVAAFAAAVRDSLRPDLKVYVEYSNEVWHTGFPGGQYAQSMGLAMNLTEEGNRWYGGATNEARLCFVAQRTANISRIWKAAWGERAGQVVVVVSGQAVWPITSDKLLSCGASYEHIDALAIAPYFGTYAGSPDTSLETFLASTLPAQLEETAALAAQHAAIAAKYGKPLLSYEGGQGLVGDGSSTDLAIQANRHPAMSGLYRTYFTRMAETGVSRVVHFSSIGAYSRYGSWGLLEAQDQDRREAPKYQGLMSYVYDSLTCPLPPPPAPATCPGATGDGTSCSGHGECLSDGSCMCYAGYSGANCSTVKYIEVYGKCGYRCTFDQGWCNVSTVTGLTRTWGCTCKKGISGLTCSIVSCPNNCSWNGDCIDQGICSCYPGYTGADCSTDCGCGGHGRCDTKGGCICDVGWRLGASRKCEWDCSGCDPGVGCIGPGECGCANTCVYGTCFAGRCRCWAGYGGPACNVSAEDAAASPAAGGPAGGGSNVSFTPRVNRGSLAGINLAGLSYWSTEWVWTDVMKGSSRWFTSFADDTSWENAFDTGTPLELRPDGYPARLPPSTVAHKLLLRDVQLHAWPGRYVVLYDGDGRLDFNFDAKVLSRAKGRLEILFTPTANLACAATGAAYCGDNGIHLSLTATNPANPLRNIRILPSAPPAPAASPASAGGPGAGGTWEGRAARTPFHPWFLKSVARYRILRFTSWQNTNSERAWTAAAGGGGGGDGWSRRTTPAYDTQAGEGGVAVEHMVQLANIVGADPWVSVHHLADDGAVGALAALLREGLRPDVKVYVEHSNEVWNPLFAQHAYARSQGLQLGLSTNPFVAAYRYHARRTAAIGDIFRSAFSTAPGGGSDRVRVVLGGWGFLCNGGSGCGAVVLRETLGWEETASKVDYYGVTGYWDCGGLGANGPVDALLSVEQMVARCYDALPNAEAAARALADAAAPYGVPLITYEAGPSIVEPSAIERGSATDALTTKLVALGRRQEMYDLYGAYLEAFRRAGLVGAEQPWMQFASVGLPGKYGSWGLKEYTGQDPASAPKYRALMDWLDQRHPQQGPGPGPTAQRPRCLSLAASGGAGAAGLAGTAGGGMALGEGVLVGPPAVQLPAAGQVLVQNRSYVARWATVGWPAGPSRPLDVTLWFDSDCDTDATSAKPPGQALLTLAANAPLSPPGELTWRVPLAAELPALGASVAAVAAAAAAISVSGGSGINRRDPRFFLRISDGLTTNYSEPFDIQPPYVYVTGAWGPCNCNTASVRRSLACYAAAGTAPPDLAPPTPTPTCRSFRGWVLTQPAAPMDPVCSLDPVTGCRAYRTSNTGGWPFSVFKPVTDCAAQTSPWPRATPTSGAAAAAVPLARCAAAAGGQPAPAATRLCSDAEYAVACPGRVRSPPPPLRTG